ncbi:uncharacterized protein LOC131222600 isoform X2 [Magnolia sinica]|nr:uncharacterized protein LOC131222600 isoform X2 [Magnolia sinica]
MARADDSHAPLLSAFPQAPLSFKRIHGMSSPDALNQHHFARYMHRRSRRPLTSFLPREDCMYSRVLTGSSFLMRKSTTTSISSFQIEFATIIFYHLQGAQNPSNEQRIRDLHMRAPEEAV